MIFINNKYTTWYNSLINKAKDRTITGYTEKHHIIPSSLGGTNDNDNIVKLTAREHFICHLLLTKMTTGNARYKMNFALHMLSNVKNIGLGRYTPTSRMYEYTKKLFIESLNNIWTSDKRAIQAEKTRQEKTGKNWDESRKKEWGKRTWSEKALTNRLNNCLKAAEVRKGSKWTDEKHKQMFDVYVEKNKHLFPQVLSMADNGITIRKISLNLSISWDRVKYILVNRDRINNI